MKPINKYLIIFLSLFLFAACDFMDCNESDYYSKEQIQGSYARVKQFVTNVYSYLPQDFCSIDGAMQDAATDDAIHVYKTSNVQRFVNGTWSANTTIDDKFSNYYSGIHDANFYLENMVGLTFEDWKYGDEYEDWMKEYPNYEYEIRFLRAFFYFELVKRYKNIPLITKVVTKEEANNAEPVAAGVILDFIISECTEMAQLLPVSYTNFGKEQETGRVTKGVALALKARAALYAASPLFNPDNDKSKWIAAAEAAYEIIGNQSALGYTLDKNFANLFGTQNNRSQEVIWARPNGENNGFEASNFPMGVTGGKTSTCPTENLASASENLDDATGQLTELLVLIQDVIKENQVSIKSLSKNLAGTTGNLNQITSKFDRSIKQKSLDNTMTSIDESVKNVQTLTSSLNGTTQSINTAMPRIDTTLYETQSLVSNANAITCGIRQTLSKRFGGLRILFGKTVKECECNPCRR